MCYGTNSFATELCSVHRSPARRRREHGPSDSDPSARAGGHVIRLLYVLLWWLHLWIFPGVQKSCWANLSAAFNSTSCVQSNELYQFPNQYLPAGLYTVCVGPTGSVSRVPGTLVVATANPSTFTATTGVQIFTNQGSPAVVNVTGTGLLTTDEIFLLPNTTRFGCHDLRDSQMDIRRNQTLSGWFLPNTQPYALTSATSGVQWSISDSSLRFSSSILTDSTLCDQVSVSCTFSLCFKRTDTSWGPVPF